MTPFVKYQAPSTDGVPDPGLLDAGSAVGDTSIGAPDWFTRAIADAPVAVDVHRDGRALRAYTWGRPSSSTVVLVHGMGANAHWWDHVASMLHEPDRQIVTVDLAGHGRSAHRAEYSMREWAEDVMAVCAELGADRPVLVGHSAGGRVCATAAAMHPARVRGLVVIDSAIVPGTSRTAPAGRGQPPGTALRVYPDRDEIIARFRTLPPQRVVLPFVQRYIAEQSIEEAPGGWRWIHDPGLYGQSRSSEGLPARFGCPLVYLRCENGSVDPAIGPLLEDHLASPVSYFELPDSGHHVMLDHPLALVAMLRVILHDLTTREETTDV